MPSASAVRCVAGPARRHQKSPHNGALLDASVPRPASRRSSGPEQTMPDIRPGQIDEADADLIYVTSAAASRRDPA
ncbi:MULTISPECIES: hypothetical protein [Streptomyces]